MKELSIEEKAKRYDDVVSKLGRFMAQGVNPLITRADVQDFFPELAESEDDKIRAFLVDFIKVCKWTEKEDQGWPTKDACVAWLGKQGNLIVELQKTYVEIGRLVKENCYLKEKQGEQKPVEWSGVDNAIVEGICLALEYSSESGETIEKYENWLHSIKDRVLPLNEVLKQKPSYCHHEVDLSNCSEEYTKGYYDGWNNCNQQHAQLEAEQKPTEWSEEDEKRLDNTITQLKAASNIIVDDEVDDSIAFIKSLKNRVQPQPKQEWDKEDEKCIRLTTDIIDSALRAGFCVQIDRDRCVDWLKSLKGRYTWKPSEEQTVALDGICSYIRNKADWEISQDMVSDLYKLSEQLKKLREE